MKLSLLNPLSGWQALLAKSVATAVFGTGLLVIGYTGGLLKGEVDAERKQLRAELAIERSHLSSLARLGSELDRLATAQAAAAASAAAAQRSLQSEIRRYARTAPDPLCLDADGLRLWQRANALAHPATEAAGLGDAAMPAAAPAVDGERDRAARQSRRHDGAVPRVPGQAPAARGPREGAEP